MTLATAISFKVTCHNTPDNLNVGDDVELAKFATRGSRSFNMGYGRWGITLSVPENDAETRKILEGNIRDGDWVKYKLTDKDNVSSTLWGFVSSVRKVSLTNPRTRAKTITYTLNGSGWARVLTSSILIGTAMRGKEDVKVKRIAGVKTKDSDGAPKIPGIITIDRWADIITTVLSHAYTGFGITAALKKLVTVALDDVWKNPKGQSFVEFLSWNRFGKIPGIAWRMINAIGIGTSISPDSILRQTSCEAYNEVFYDYNEKGKPAIVLRPRYNPSYRNDIAKIPNDATCAIDTSRSGAERFNYWRPSWAMQPSRGIEIPIDQGKGQSPIIDRDSIERYGLHTVMPQNDLIPQLHSDTDLLQYHIEKIKEFRGWYYNNPEFITGSVRMKGVYPNKFRVGKYCEVPESYWVKWRGANERRPSFVGYMVDITETFSVDAERAVDAETTVTFIRGDDKYAMKPKVPQIDPWINTSPVTQERFEDLGSEYITKHIKWSDLRCKDGNSVPRDPPFEENAKNLCLNVEKIMDELTDYKISITSGYRTWKYNTGLDGAALDSQHMYAAALDFSLADTGNEFLFSVIDRMMRDGKILRGGVHAYKTFVHYDIRGHIAYWKDKDEQ